MTQFTPPKFIIGFVIVQGGIDDNRWIPCGVSDTTEEAVAIMKARAARGGALVVAVFPAENWVHGQVSCEPIARKPGASSAVLAGRSY